LHISVQDLVITTFS
nr:immunoglobulin heavy chain junction region [Mus musculus]